MTGRAIARWLLGTVAAVGVLSAARPAAGAEALSEADLARHAGGFQLRYKHCDWPDGYGPCEDPSECQLTVIGPDILCRQTIPNYGYYCTADTSEEAVCDVKVGWARYQLEGPTQRDAQGHLICPLCDEDAGTSGECVYCTVQA